MYRILSAILFIHTLQIWHSAAQTEDCKCGLANRRRRIIGGGETETNEYPWMAFLEFPLGNDLVSNCGGSLINNQWVLSAAHCAPNVLPLVSLGDHNVSTPQETNSTIFKVVKRIDHPAFKLEYPDDLPPYDFSLLKLEQPVDFSKQSNIRPICLPTDDSEIYDDFPAIVTGWGILDTDGTDTNTLQEVNVQTFSNDQCKDMLSNTTIQIEDPHICAGNQDENKGNCKGDSGGPLITSRSGDGVTLGQNYEIIGVVSGGEEICISTKYPGVYSRVTSVLDWIKKNTRGSQTCPRVSLIELC